MANLFKFSNDIDNVIKIMEFGSNDVDIVANEIKKALVSTNGKPRNGILSISKRMLDNKLLITLFLDIKETEIHIDTMPINKDSPKIVKIDSSPTIISKLIFDLVF